PTEIIRRELLFQSSGADRSPAAWMERLTGRKPVDAAAPPRAVEASPRPPSGDGSAEPSPGARSPQLVAARSGMGPALAPDPLPEATRRFLRPLVGIDPAA